MVKGPGTLVPSESISNLCARSVVLRTRVLVSVVHGDLLHAKKILACRDLLRDLDRESVVLGGESSITTAVERVHWSAYPPKSQSANTKVGDVLNNTIRVRLNTDLQKLKPVPRAIIVLNITVRGLRHIHEHRSNVEDATAKIEANGIAGVDLGNLGSRTSF